MLESELQMDFPSENEQPEENIINEEGGEEYAWKSATLLKITQSRISDMRELVDRRNRVKHEDDIWWESRNPKLYEKSPTKYADVESRLNRSTKSYESGRRPKASLNNAQLNFNFSKQGNAFDKKSPSPEKTTGPDKPTPSSTSPKTTKSIGIDSHLLKPTAQCQNSVWHGKSDRLSIERPKTQPIQLVTKIKGTGPKTVNSRLTFETTCVASAKWKSKEDLLEEQKKVETGKPQVTVKATSEKLLKPTVAMKHHQTTKKGKTEKDPREEGWNVFGITKDTEIPPVDLGQPYRIPAPKRTPARTSTPPSSSKSCRKSPKSPETDTSLGSTGVLESEAVEEAVEEAGLVGEVVEEDLEVKVEEEEEVVVEGEEEVKGEEEEEVEGEKEKEVEVEGEVEAVVEVENEAIELQ